MDNILDLKFPANYRMPPLNIASMKRRIQRPSYVPADEDGNRLITYKTKTGSTFSKSSTSKDGRDAVTFADIATITELNTPNSPSSNRRTGVKPAESSSLIRNSRLHTSLDHIDSVHTPASPGPICRPRSRTLPQSETLPPVCITSDFNSRNNTPDIPEPCDDDVPTLPKSSLHDLMLDVYTTGDNSAEDSSQLEALSQKSRQSTKKKRRRRIKSDTDADTDITKLDISPRRTVLEPGSRHMYVKVCHMLDVPVSQSLYHSFSLDIINLKYHHLSLIQVKALAITLSKNTTVRVLNLNSTAMTDASFRYICDVLSVNQTIRELHAADNKLTSVSAERLQETMENNRTLELLDLSGNSMKDSDAGYFAEIIKTTSTLKKLTLNNNMFGEEAGLILGRVIGCNSTLISVELSWNQLRRDSARQLINMMRTNCTLRELDLSWNGLGEEGCAGLAEFLKVNRTLQKLDVSSNRIKQNSFRQLTRGLTKNNSLQDLKVGKNPITGNGILEFLAKLVCLQMSDIPALEQLRSIDFKDIAVGREVTTLYEMIKLHYPHMEICFGSVSHESLKHCTAHKQDYMKLNVRQARLLLCGSLRSVGLEPEYILPKSSAILWDLQSFKSALQAMSVSLSNGAINLILSKLATKEMIQPSTILIQEPVKQRVRSSHNHNH